MFPDRKDIIEQARKCIGTPYFHIGRKIGTREEGGGLDCCGLITAGVAQPLGITDDDFLDYEPIPGQGILIKMLRKFAVEIPMESMVPGDIPVFRIMSEPQHLGILAENKHGLTFVHTWTKTKEVRETTYDQTWKDRLCYAFAFPGMEDIKWQL